MAASLAPKMPVLTCHEFAREAVRQGAACICHAYEATGGRVARCPLAGVASRGNGCGPPAPGRDPQIAHIFRNMRAATRLSREAVARRLATTPATIEDLESWAPSRRCRTGPRRCASFAAIASSCGSIRSRCCGASSSCCAAGGRCRRARRRPVRGPPPPALRKDRPPRRAPRRQRAQRAASRRLLLLRHPAGRSCAASPYLASLAPAPFYRALSLLPAVRGRARACRARRSRAILRPAPRRPQVDRRRRPPVAQGRQVADKGPVDSLPSRARCQRPQASTLDLQALCR